MYRVYYQIWLKDQLTMEAPFIQNMKRFPFFAGAESFARECVEAAIASGDILMMTVAGVGTWDDDDVIELSVNI